ncbi:MAG: M28 family peptidase [Gemmatimonadetes bacterium]|nr:M28 family peptidase [Gemmatimonadota bacterium]
MGRAALTPIRPSLSRERRLGIRSRRTIRIACWSGEEQGLLGSRARVTSRTAYARPTSTWIGRASHCARLNPTAMFLRP